MKKRNRIFKFLCLLLCVFALTGCTKPITTVQDKCSVMMSLEDYDQGEKFGNYGEKSGTYTINFVDNINVDGVDYPAMTIFHPSYLLRNHSTAEGAPRTLMAQDLREIKNTYLNDIHRFGSITMEAKENRELALV